MNSIFWSILISVLLGVVTVGGDTMIKNASMKNGFSGWRELLLGLLIFVITGIGWFFVFRHLKLSTAAVIYSVCIILFSVVISVFVYKEQLTINEIIGIALAVASLIILVKYA